MIIALTGPQGCGKDTVGGMLAKRGFTTMAFADAVRAEIVASFGCDLSLLVDRSTKEIQQVALSLSHCDDNEFANRMIELHASLPEKQCGDLTAFLRQPRSPLWVMQQWDEYHRKQHGADYWCKRLQERIEATPGDIVITDCTRDNEAEFLSFTHALNSEIWLITRPGCEPKPGHESENPVDESWIDRWIDNNGDPQELEAETLECLAYANHSIPKAA